MRKIIAVLCVAIMATIMCVPAFASGLTTGESVRTISADDIGTGTLGTKDLGSGCVLYGITIDKDNVLENYTVFKK